ncbi:MAG: hypothetical protein WBG95_12265 [Sulfitobacter sp.]
MAYLMTAIATGGVAALITFFTGGSIGQVAWNYVLYGHMGMLVLLLAAIASSKYYGEQAED